MPNSWAIAPRVKPSSRKRPTARRLNSKENRFDVFGRPPPSPLGGRGAFFTSLLALLLSFMLTLHLMVECQPFLRSSRSHDLVARTNNAAVKSFLWGTDLSGTIQGAGGVGGLLAVNVGGTVAFPRFDGNGNVLGLVSAADGTVAAQYAYGPFGDVIRSTGPLAIRNPFRFSTKYQDDETDLLYYGYRYYHALNGRWISRDPIEESGSINLYSILQNDVLSNSDMLGLIGWGPLVGAAASCLADLLAADLKDKFDAITACSAASAEAGIGDFCQGHRFAAWFHPSGDHNELADKLLNCVLSSAGGAGIKKLTKKIKDEALKELIEKVLDEGKDAAIDAITNVRGKLMVEAKCKKKVLNVSLFWQTEFEFEGRTLSIENAPDQTHACAGFAWHQLNGICRCCP